MRFDLPEEGISSGKPVSLNEIDKAEKELGVKFPQSFIDFLRTYGAPIGISGINNTSGNFSTDYLFPKDKGTYGIVDSSKEMAKDGWATNGNFIVFGSNGNGSYFAFYTKFQKNDEMPVVMVSMDYSEDEPYVLMSTSFKGFVNTYVHIEILRSLQEKENLDELLEKSKKLVKKYEPKISNNFANQLVDWEWNYISAKELDNKIKNLLK